jgi:NTE family protein
MLREHLFAEVKRLPEGERPVVGLVLSAGAVRGLAHVGVWQVLEDAGFPVDVVAGTSMGAVVGSFVASGIPAAKMREIGSGVTLASGSDYSKTRLVSLILRDKLLDSTEMESVLKDAIGDRTFDQLPRPFACVSMDIRTGEKVIFRDGPVATAVRASANLPGIFKPVAYRHRWLVDGGVVDYIPVDAARLLGAEWVLASVTEGDFTYTNPTNVLMTLEQVIDIRGSILSRQQRREADALVEPRVGDVEFHQTERIPEVISKGMEAGARSLAAAQESLSVYSMPRLWKRWNAAR